MTKVIRVAKSTSKARLTAMVTPWVGFQAGLGATGGIALNDDRVVWFPLGGKLYFVPRDTCCMNYLTQSGNVSDFAWFT